MKAALFTSRAEAGLLIAYDPGAPYPYLAYWEADQVSDHKSPQAPVGQGNTPQEAIDCLYALMARWCVHTDHKLPLTTPREAQAQIDSAN